MAPKYRIRFFCEWGAGSLWPGSELTREDFGLGPYDLLDEQRVIELPLSGSAIERCRQIDSWHHGSLNWEYPPDPGPWRQAECDRFNLAVKQLIKLLQTELGPNFTVVNVQPLMAEDPELDRYLANPTEFRRATGN